jgi:hypothetical protein
MSYDYNHLQEIIEHKGKEIQQLKNEINECRENNYKLVEDKREIEKIVIINNLDL